MGTEVAVTQVVVATATGQGVRGGQVGAGEAMQVSLGHWARTGF